MYNRQSRMHRRWMGSHTLVGLTLLADLVGMGLTALAGGFLLPLIGSILIWLLQVLAVVTQHIVRASQPDLALFICVGTGTLIGLLLALGLAGVFNGPYTTHHDGRLGKSLFAFVSTVLTALLCWLLLAQFLHSSPLVWPPALAVQWTINPLWAMLWLAYYLGAHGFYALTAPKHVLTMGGQCLYRYQPIPPSTAAGRAESRVPQGRPLVLAERAPTWVPPSLQATVPVSRAHPGGPKWQYIQNCYELYHKALTRFDPQPLTLQKPDGFRYDDGSGQQMSWYKHTLLIPKAFLDPTWRQVFLPELARQLMYYNAPDLRVFELLQSYPRNARDTLLFLGTLNFLWVPTMVKNIAGQRWQVERVLDADAFAYILGEGMRLRARLRAEQQALRREELGDDSFPTLDERLEHLNALIREEARQLRELGYSWETDQNTLDHLAVHPVPPTSKNTLLELGSESTGGEQ